MLRDSIVAAVKRAIAANPSLASKLSIDRIRTCLCATSPSAANDDAAPAAGSRAQPQNIGSVDALGCSARSTAREPHRRFRVARNLLLGITLLSLTLAVYLITGFYLSNLRGFGALILRMRKLAQGDLTTNFAARGRDEIGQLIDSFNVSRAQLQALVQRIREVSEIDAAASRSPPPTRTWVIASRHGRRRCA